VIVKLPSYLICRVRSERYIQNLFTLNKLEVVLTLNDGGIGRVVGIINISVVLCCTGPSCLGKFLNIKHTEVCEIILKITPLSVKLVLPFDSVSKVSVLVCPNEKIEMSRLQMVKKVVLFMIFVLNLGYYVILIPWRINSLNTDNII
jgi:hypothetical protein